VSARSSAAGKSGKPAQTPRKRLKCPVCGKPRSNEFRPFCSKHCADIDLGRWLDGRYVVPGAPASTNPAEVDEDDR
jgi:endogenous inhibitor of DNA gyrase (YacG/DUF329 family)